MTNKIIIAIDGYSSCGKSTMAKALAAALEFSFIDTGAMYRAVTLHMLNTDVDASNPAQVIEELNKLKVRFTFNPARNAADTYLNGQNVENEIRTMRVSSKVSDYSAIKEVRQAMVAQQQAMGSEKGVVLDGRDIGTIVFPQAELKIFMTANPEIRAQRRFDELKAKGQSPDFTAVKNNLQERDHLDSTRAESPLRQADDAKVLDNSHMTPEEQLELALIWAKEALAKKG